MAILPRYKRLKRRDWKDPFSWFKWFHTRNNPDPVFLYRPESGRVGMIGFTATRADASTCATYRDANGIWQTVAANVLRDGHYHYDANAGQSYRTLLREAASTNSALGACSFGDGTYWSGNTSFTLAAATSCIAGQTATKHTNLGLSADRIRNQAVGTFVNGQTDCYGWFIENDVANPAVTSVLEARDTTAVATLYSATLTWATKSIATTSGTGTCGVIDLGTGPNGGALLWVWITATGTAAGTGANGNGRNAFCYLTGLGTNTLSAILHLGQFEANAAFPTSPIVTVGSAVTRAADSIYVSWPYAPAGATAYIDAYDLMGASGGQDRGAFSIGDASVNTAAWYLRKVTPTDLWRAQAKMASGSSVSTQAAGSTYGQRVELRAFLTVSGANVTTTVGQSINGAAETVAAAGASQTLDAAFSSPARLYIGSLGTGNISNLALRSLCIVLGPEQTMQKLRQITRG